MSSELKQTTPYDYEHDQDATGSSITDPDKIVAADPIQAEEVPTIPIDSRDQGAAGLSITDPDKIVAADLIQAEEVPAIPIDSHEQDAASLSITDPDKIVAADPIQAEEVPTIPIDSRKQSAASLSITNPGKIVAADPIQAEEVPTIPIDSLELVASLQPAISVHSVDMRYLSNLPAPLVAQPSEYQRSLIEWFQIWWDGIRPGYLILSLSPILLGTTLAWTQTVHAQTPLGQLDLSYLIGGILLAFLIQIAGHLINDYYDYVRGIDTGNILGSGGLIQQRYVKPTLVLMIGLILLGIGTIFGLVLSISRGSLMLYPFGLLIVLAAYFYSAPPRPLSSIALGEISGFILFGPLLTLGAYMAQTGGSLPASAFIYSLPPGLLAMAVIHTNNIRDRETDANAQKLTLAYLIGLKASRFIYLLLLFLACSVIGVLGVVHEGPHLILLTFWTLPLLIVACSGIVRTKAPAGFHMVMRETLHIEIYFVLLLITGLALTALIPVLPRVPTHLLPF